jgi:hypothetical protein
MLERTHALFGLARNEVADRPIEPLVQKQV